jgi:hypothetical protein
VVIDSYIRNRPMITGASDKIVIIVLLGMVRASIMLQCFTYARQIIVFFCIRGPLKCDIDSLQGIAATTVRIIRACLQLPG